jgi:hypothetical protein
MSQATTSLLNLRINQEVSTLVVDKLNNPTRPSYKVRVYNMPEALLDILQRDLELDSVRFNRDPDRFVFITREKEVSQEYILGIHRLFLEARFRHLGFETYSRGELDREFYSISSQFTIRQKEFEENHQILLRAEYQLPI